MQYEPPGIGTQILYLLVIPPVMSAAIFVLSRINSLIIFAVANQSFAVDDETKKRQADNLRVAWMLGIGIILVIFGAVDVKWTIQNPTQHEWLKHPWQVAQQHPDAQPAPIPVPGP